MVTDPWPLRGYCHVTVPDARVPTMTVPAAQVIAVDVIHSISPNMVAPPSKFYTVSNVLFCKYGGANIAVKNWMSNFICLSQTRPLWNWLVEKQDIHKELGFLCCFPNCFIVYPVVTVYYCLGSPSSTISLCALKLYFGYQKVTSKPF